MEHEDDLKTFPRFLFLSTINYGKKACDLSAEPYFRQIRASNKTEKLF
jgi:hypothetical protein